MNDIHFYISEHMEFVVIRQGLLHFDEHVHTHNIVVSALLSGKVKLVLDGNENTVPEGAIFSLLPYENHALISDAPVDMISMCIKKELIALDAKELKDLISCSLSGLRRQEDIIREDMADKLCRTALAVCEAAREIASDEDGYITDDRSRLEAHPELDEDINSLADHSYMSKYHYIRRFKRIAGLTPNRFRVQNRIRKAQHMLRDGKSLTETALNVGFYDQSHFNKYFKRIVGIAPGEYIRSLRNFLQE